jgi:hypothetical protein
VFDLKAGNWLQEKELPITNQTGIITKDKIIYLEKDTEHYYFNYIQYYEL